MVTPPDLVGCMAAPPGRLRPTFRLDQVDCVADLHQPPEPSLIVGAELGDRMGQISVNATHPSSVRPTPLGSLSIRHPHHPRKVHVLIAAAADKGAAHRT
jgi:hypothetical protein